MIKPLRSISLGIIAALTALIFEVVVLFFIRGNIELDFTLKSIAFLSTLAFIEELAKFSFIYSISQKATSKKEVLGNAFFIGFGFALSEFAFKIFSFKEGIFQENLAAFAFHLISSLLIGFFLSRKKDFSRFYLASLVFLLTIFHLAFNLFFIFLFAKDL